MPKTQHVGELGEKLRNRVKTGRKLDSKVRKEKQARRQEANILTEVQKVLAGESVEISRWMQELADVKTRVKVDSPNAVQELEEKMHRLAVAMNLVFDLLRRRAEKYEGEAKRLDKVDLSLTHFFRDTVDEINEMSKNVRTWEAEWQNEMERKRKIALPEGNHGAPRLAGSLFTLYKFDEDADIKDIFGKKKKRAASKRARRN